MKIDNSQLRRRMIQSLVFGFIVFLALALVSDIRQFGSAIIAFNWALFPLIILLTLSNYFLRFIKWHIYIRQIGAASISIPDSLRLFIAGFPLAMTPGKIGEAMKGIWLNRMTGVPAAKGVSVVLAERISDGFSVLLLSTLGVIAYPMFWPVFLLVLLALIGFVILTQMPTLSNKMITFAARFPFLTRISKSLMEFIDGAHQLFRPKLITAAVSLGFFSWLFEGIGFYLVLIGLGIERGNESLFVAIFVLSFSTIIGAVSALPGGLGAAELSIAGMLAVTLHLQPVVATAATLLIRVATLWFGVSLGLITWGFSRKLLNSTRNIDHVGIQ